MQLLQIISHSNVKTSDFVKNSQNHTIIPRLFIFLNTNY